MPKESTTVEELIEELRKYPAAMNIVSTATDCGGYDSILVRGVLVVPVSEMKTFFAFEPEEKGCLYVGGKDEE